MLFISDMDARRKRFSRKKFARMVGVPEATFLANLRRLIVLIEKYESRLLINS